MWNTGRKKVRKERKTENKDKSINLSTSLSSNDDCNRGLVWYVCVCHRTINIHETWNSERGNRMKKKSLHVRPRVQGLQPTKNESIKNFNAHEELRICKRIADDDKERKKKKRKKFLGNEANFLHIFVTDPGQRLLQLLRSLTAFTDSKIVDRLTSLSQFAFFKSVIWSRFPPPMN